MTQNVSMTTSLSSQSVTDGNEILTKTDITVKTTNTTQPNTTRISFTLFVLHEHNST